MPPIKAHRIIIDRVRDDRSRTDNLGCGTATPYSVGQNISAQSPALHRIVQRQTANEKKRNLMRKVSLKFGRWQRVALFHRRRDRIVADDTCWLCPCTDHIGPGGKPLPDQRMLF